MSTGSELLNGSVIDFNAPYTAKAIKEAGGKVCHNTTTGDEKAAICQSLQQLLDQSDAVIVTGGLGPTSDDNTRSALSEVTKQVLTFDETSWCHIQQRHAIWVALTDANKKQAYFLKEPRSYKILMALKWLSSAVAGA